jgi:hypothetical protein
MLAIAKKIRRRLMLIEPLWRFACIEAFQSAMENLQQEAPWHQSGDSASDFLQVNPSA